jgi:hypothetical protein
LISSARSVGAAGRGTGRDARARVDRPYRSRRLAGELVQRVEGELMAVSGVLAVVEHGVDDHGEVGAGPSPPGPAAGPDAPTVRDAVVGGSKALKEQAQLLVANVAGRL